MLEVGFGHRYVQTGSTKKINDRLSEQTDKVVEKHASLKFSVMVKMF